MKNTLNVKSLISTARGNISMILTACLVFLLIAEALVIRQSVSIIFASRKVSTLPKSLLVRINFDLYGQIAKRFGEVEDTPLTPVTSRSPFTPLEVSEIKSIKKQP